MSELRKKLVLGNLLPPLPPNAGGKKSGGFGSRKRDYSPVSWRKYFDKRTEVKVDKDSVFCTYEKGTEGPLVVCLHGGGFSALSWALFAADLHQRARCRCLSIDFRGHGETVTANDADLRAETLADDVCRVVNTLYGEDQPPIILIGHSMGGAVAIRIASSELLSSLVALMVIDVVEGSAMEALCGMKTFLRSRPAKFTSLENAIEWSVRSGQLRNVDSARVSMAGQIKRLDGAFAISSELDAAARSAGSTSLRAEDASVRVTDAIAEEDEVSDAERAKSTVQAHSSEPDEQLSGEVAASVHTVSTASRSLAPGHFVWRIKLEDTEQFWEGWFKGMSHAFLSVSVPKMLLLAGTDRLDKDLTIGQMQGKFQMQVLPRVGHAVHEDSPDKVADVVASFMIRYRFAEATEEFSNDVSGPGC